MQSSDIEQLLRGYSLTKVLSTIYKSLFPETPILLQPCMSFWDDAAAPGLDTDGWDDIWEVPLTCLESARDHLIQ